jgi:hypothetical protein
MQCDKIILEILSMITKKQKKLGNEEKLFPIKAPICYFSTPIIVIKFATVIYSNQIDKSLKLH